MLFTTKRLNIRQVNNNDAAHLLRLMNSEGFINNIGDKQVTNEKQVIELIKSRYSAEYPNFGMFIVEDKISKQWLGTVSLIQRIFLPYPDIGYAFLPEFYRKGYAFEASLGLIEYCKKQGYNYLYGVVDDFNLASINLLKKLQFQEDGTVLMEGETTPILKFKRALS